MLNISLNTDKKPKLVLINKFDRPSDLVRFKKLQSQHKKKVDYYKGELALIESKIGSHGPFLLFKRLINLIGLMRNDKVVELDEMVFDVAKKIMEENNGI